MRKFFIYGAGNIGRQCYSFLKWRGLREYVYGFLDQRFNKIIAVEGIKVYEKREIERRKVPVVVAIGDEDERNRILRELGNNNYEAYGFDELYKLLDEDETTCLGVYYEYFCEVQCDEWYKSAENIANVNFFWKEDSVFYEMFQQLDLDNVIEVGCGYGRHVPKYLNVAKQITLVDTNEKALCNCKKRFAKYDNINYCKNEGYNLKDIKDNTYSALFSYETFINFELINIYQFLKEINRILRKGGKALIHHSNYYQGYNENFIDSKCHCRSFMSKEIFYYLAIRSGFKVLEQKIVDAADYRKLDCVSLLQK